MCFESVELCLENSLLLLKARLGNDGMNVAESAGGLIFFFFFTPFVQRDDFTSSEVFAFMLFAFRNSRVRTLRCPDSRSRGRHALLLHGVYLQTVTLMRCNDYFYSRYFGSQFALSGMTPHWPTDYLCGCCHTWLLQLSTRSTIITSALPLFITTPSSVPSSLSLSQYTFTNATVSCSFFLLVCFYDTTPLLL